MITKNKRLLIITGIIISLLIIPIIAMQFTNEVNWTVGDFLVAGVLLFGTGLGYELVMRNVSKKNTRVFLGVGIIISLLLIWAELAVGIFGTPLAGS